MGWLIAEAAMWAAASGLLFWTMIAALFGKHPWEV